MRDQLKRLGTESFVYGVGQVGGRAVQLLLVPVLTRALVPQAFGISELVAGYSQSILTVLVMGMDGALARFFYQEPHREARIRMVSSSLVFRLVASVTLAGLLAAFAGPLSAFLMSGAVYRKYFTLGALTLPFTLFVMFGNDVLRVTFQPVKFIALNLTQTVLATSLALYFVLVRHAGVVGVLYGRLIGDALSSILALVLIRHTLAPRFSRTALRRMFGYGMPTVPGAFAFAFLAGLDRYFMQRFRTLEEVAVYAVSLKFFAVVMIAASAFQLAYGPFAYARAGSPEAPRLYARVFGAFMAVGPLGALLVASFVPDVLHVLVPPQYALAAGPALWLAFAAVALGAYTIASIGIGLSLKTPLLTVCAIGAFAVTLGAHLLLTRRFGGPGAAVATFLGYSTAAWLTYRIAQAVHPMPFRGGRAAALFVLALGLALLVQRFAPAGPGGLPAKLAAVAVFAAAVWALRVLRDEGAVAPQWRPPAPAA